MITIYWGVNTSYPSLSGGAGIRAEAPISILQKMSHERIPKDFEFEEQARLSRRTSEYNRCPAFVDELMNVYGIKSYYDYTLRFGKDNVTSPDYDQEFFKNHFNIKSLKFEGNLFEFYENFVFFTDEPSLEMSLLPAYMEDNSVVNSTIMIPGQFDIGKYFRELSFAFHTRENCNEIIFNRKEIYFYLKFHTKKKLRFKQFAWTDELTRINRLMSAAKNMKYDFMNLDYYYNIFERFNFKKKILKSIKENLCIEV